MTQPSATGLAQYLEHKAAAMRATAAAKPTGPQHLERISATCVADDLTGVRKVQIRDWPSIGDSEAEMGGWGLGPTSPELLCGVMSTCLVHTYIAGAAMRGVPLERVEVQVSASNNDARFFGVETDDPPVPFDLTAKVTIDAPDASGEALDALHRYADESCPMLRVLRTPNTVTIVTE